MRQRGWNPSAPRASVWKRKQTLLRLLHHGNVHLYSFFPMTCTCVLPLCSPARSQPGPSNQCRWDAVHPLRLPIGIARLLRSACACSPLASWCCLTAGTSPPGPALRPQPLRTFSSPPRPGSSTPSVSKRCLSSPAGFYRKQDERRNCAISIQKLKKKKKKK